MDNISVRATKQQILDFKESILWKDIVEELTMWKKSFNAEMLSIVDEAASDNPSTATVLLHLGDLNGRQKAVDYMLGILDVFLSIIESKEQENDFGRNETD
jgi:hypothetical protein